MSIKERLKKEITPALMKSLKISNALRAPRPIVGYVQIGIGRTISQSPDSKERVTEEVMTILGKITGQKPKLITARKAIAGFKLREGQPVAYLVTLRKQQLAYFIDRLLMYALPRTKDFRGLEERNLDKVGNLNLGLREHGVFPETVSDKIKSSYGLQITLVGSGRTRDENKLLWEQVGFPFRKKSAHAS